MTIHASKRLGVSACVYCWFGGKPLPFSDVFALAGRFGGRTPTVLCGIDESRKEMYAQLLHVQIHVRATNTSEPSRFIQEIDPAFLDIEIANKAEAGRSLNLARPVLAQPTSGLSGSFKSVKQVRPMNDHLKKNDQIKVGHVVLHEKFGKGKVLAFEGDGSDKKVKIYFTGSGEKTLLCEVCELDVVD
jgi:DNA helicase II / ATP-dependent DNA helicase PcrA